MRKFQLISALSITLLMFVACSGGPPSGGQARAKLKDLIHKRSDDNIELVDFRKTDGQSREKNKTQIYEMDFQSKIRIKTTCYWTARNSSGLFSPMFSTVTEMPKGGFDVFGAKYAGKTKSAAGKKYNLSGSIVFEQKESGWNIADINLKVSK